MFYKHTVGKINKINVLLLLLLLLKQNINVNLLRP